MYTGESANFKNLMKTEGVEEAINVEVDGIMLPDWVIFCFTENLEKNEANL